MVKDSKKNDNIGQIWLNYRFNFLIGRSFWHGVDAIVEIQKSSGIDTENYSISAAPKERSTDEKIETVI